MPCYSEPRLRRVFCPGGRPLDPLLLHLTVDVPFEEKEDKIPCFQKLQSLHIGGVQRLPLQLTKSNKKWIQSRDFNELRVSIAPSAPTPKDDPALTLGVLVGLVEMLASNAVVRIDVQLMGLYGVLMPMPTSLMDRFTRTLRRRVRRRKVAPKKALSQLPSPRVMDIRLLGLSHSDLRTIGELSKRATDELTCVCKGSLAELSHLQQGDEPRPKRLNVVVVLCDLDARTLYDLFKKLDRLLHTGTRVHLTIHTNIWGAGDRKVLDGQFRPLLTHLYFGYTIVA